MNHSTDRNRLTLEQAVWSVFRTRAATELRLLNEHLPLSRRLERREIDRIADDLLHAVQRTPKLRNASLLDKTMWTASAVLVRAIRGRRRMKQTASGAPLWNRKAGDEGKVSEGDLGTARRRGNQAEIEIPGRSCTDKKDKSRVAAGHLQNTRSTDTDREPGSTGRPRDELRTDGIDAGRSLGREPAAQAPEC